MPTGTAGSVETVFLLCVSAGLPSGASGVLTGAMAPHSLLLPQALYEKAGDDASLGGLHVASRGAPARSTGSGRSCDNPPSGPRARDGPS